MIAASAMMALAWVFSQAAGQETARRASDAPSTNPQEFGVASDAEQRSDPPEQTTTQDTIDNGATRIYFYKCQHKEAPILKRHLDWLVPGIPYCQPFGGQNIDVSTRAGRSTAAAAHDVLIIEDTPERLQRIRQILLRLDVSRPQVLIDARVIEVQSTRSFEMGFNVELDRTGITNAFFQGFELNYNPSAYLEALPTTHPPEFQGMSMLFNNTWDPDGRSAKTFGLSGVAIRALQQNNQAEILANPRLLVEEDATARIFSGEDVFIQEITSPRGGIVTIQNKAKNAGITLDIRPVIVSRNSVKLHLVPSVKEITGFTTPSESGVANPIISSRSADTLATVEDGKTLVIGGLILTENRIETRGIPLLADLPLVGELFRNHRRTRSRSEVIFTITPYIVRDTFADSAAQPQPTATEGGIPAPRGIGR